MLKIKQLSFSQRLNSVSFDFHSKKLYAVIGLNGAGKSTFFDAILHHGHRKEISGSAMIHDRNLHNISPSSRAKIVALLSQNTALQFEYCVKDIIMMGAYCYRNLSVKQKTDKFNEVIDLFRISKHKNKRYHQLSGGQKQKVQMARVLYQLIVDDVKQQKWLLLDEHTAGLDLYQQIQSFELLKELLSKYNIGVIAIIHDLALAAKYADEILLIDKGELVLSGKSEKVLESQIFSRIFRVSLEDLSKACACL